MSKLNLTSVAICGAGQRFFEIYLPILRDLVERDEIELVGLHNRGAERGQQAAQALNCPFFSSFGQLLACPAEAIINVVKGRAKSGLGLAMLRAGKHVFLETPAADDVKTAKMIRDLARARGLVVQVAEDDAFTPLARQQADLVRSGALGQPILICNDEGTFGYHATARLGQLLSSGDQVRDIRCIKTKIGPRDTWLESHQVRFESGLLFTQRFVWPKDHFSRSQGHWKIVCENGIIPSIEAGQDSARLALAYLLEGFLSVVRGQGVVSYGYQQAVRDLALWHAMRLAARIGLPFRIPRIFFHELSK